MSKLATFAEYVTSARKESFTALDSPSRLEVVKDFFSSKGLDLPGSITVTTTKKGSYLSKDEKLNIQSAYIQALKNNAVTPELENNFEAVCSPDKVATFSEALVYSEAVKTWGGSIVAAKMIDTLSDSLNEEFHKIRKFDVPASVAISEIPAFIKELQKIFDAAKVESEKESK